MACFSSKMPDAAVYLVKPALIASIAASHTFLGVGKSGSPAPKLTTSTPAAFICLALSEIASVEDGLTAIAFLDNPVIVLFPFYK